LTSLSRPRIAFSYAAAGSTPSSAEIFDSRAPPKPRSQSAPSTCGVAGSPPLSASASIFLAVASVSPATWRRSSISLPRPRLATSRPRLKCPGRPRSPFSPSPRNQLFRRTKCSRAFYSRSPPVTFPPFRLFSLPRQWHNSQVRADPMSSTAPAARWELTASTSTRPRTAVRQWARPATSATD